MFVVLPAEDEEPATADLEPEVCVCVCVCACARVRAWLFVRAMCRPNKLSGILKTMMTYDIDVLFTIE